MNQRLFEHVKERDSNAKLDQFYTRPEVAEFCWRKFLNVARHLGINESEYWYVEPSAGCGCFYQMLPPRRRIGIDIEPRRLPSINGKGIVCADYLKWFPEQTRREKKYAVIGNPPFGRRGRLAVEFFNHSAFADIIAFIVPVSFRKYAVHRQLLAGYKLVRQHSLDNDSFCLPNGRSYAVNTDFQIWTRLPAKMKDMRQMRPPPIKHPDFEMRQYNNTEQALPMFALPFDFAVPCQGYQDYTRRETDADKCEKHKQWILFTAKSKRVLEKLKGIDFAALAADRATATPGFRKNDVVKHYDSLPV